MLHITLYEYIVFVTEAWIVFERKLSRHFVFSALRLYDAAPERYVAGQALFFVKKKKVNVYLLSFMMKVLNHLYVLGDTYK
jgi:hypothetical protein